jgi:hypothetical protein
LRKRKIVPFWAENFIQAMGWPYFPYAKKIGLKS